MLTEIEIQQMIQTGRDFMKMPKEDPDYLTDQQLKKTQPPLVKSPMTKTQIQLPSSFDELILDTDFMHIINTRESHRVYTQQQLTLLELSYLLWCTQGVKEIRGKSYATLRTVPCGGARHEFETYFAVQYVEGLDPGLYHYLPMTHQIEMIATVDDMKEFICASVGGQTWASKASVVFYYSTVYYRAEWRYGIYAHRVALMDLGHIMQNMYMACTAAHLGTCALGYIDPDFLNTQFHLDGNEECMISCCPVGTIDEKDKLAEQDFYAFVKEQNL